MIIEEHAGGRRTVFLPRRRRRPPGRILIIDGARIHPVNVPLATAFKCVSSWGAGELLAAMRAVPS